MDLFITIVLTIFIIVGIEILIYSFTLKGTVEISPVVCSLSTILDSQRIRMEITTNIFIEIIRSYIVQIMTLLSLFSFFWKKNSPHRRVIRIINH
jgi:hypothetical protein